MTASATPPSDLKKVVSQYMRELEAQPYWQGIQATTMDKLADILTDGMADGLNNQEIGKLIADALGGKVAKRRGMAIARTEVTGAANSGHHAVHVKLAESGLITGITWSATLDKDVRPSHFSLHGTTIKPGENFSVGKGSAPYPGYWGLPPEERCNCRCTTITKSAFDDPANQNAEDDEELLSFFLAVDPGRVLGIP